MGDARGGVLIVLQSRKLEDRAGDVKGLFFLDDSRLCVRA